MPEPQKGWINRQFGRLEEESKTWPKWMKGEEVPEPLELAKQMIFEDHRDCNITCSFKRQLVIAEYVIRHEEGAEPAPHVNDWWKCGRCGGCDIRGYQEYCPGCGTKIAWRKG